MNWKALGKAILIVSIVFSIAAIAQFGTDLMVQVLGSILITATIILTVYGIYFVIDDNEKSD